jgi:flagellar assembly factor FliW
MPLGLPGFAQARTFVLLDHRPGSVFRWLQATDHPEIAFVVLDPLLFVPDYPVESVRRATGFLGIDPDEEIFVLAICTVPPAPGEPTANFLAPIGIGRTCRRGAQVVLHDSGFDSRERIFNR